MSAPLRVLRPVARASPGPSLVDGRAERALLGVLIREPHRFTDPRITRALFAMPPHPEAFTALRTAAANGALAGDIMTAGAALQSAGIAEPASLAAVAVSESENLVAAPLLRYVVKLAAQRTTRELAEALARVATAPAAIPGDDRESLASIGARVAQLAETPADERPYVRLSTVAVERVAWLWRHRIPFGKLTLLDGDPGLGKTALSLDIAARVTTGEPLEGDGLTSWEPAGVVMLNAEDGLGDTLRPRLEAAGADLSRIVAFGLDTMPTLPEGLAQVREAILDMRASLLVIDPLMAVLSASVDSYRDQDVRGVLRPIAALAASTGVAVLIVRHLTKQTGSKALYRGGGSIGISGAARSVLLVAPDPDGAENQRVLAPVKMNLCPEPVSLVFALESIDDVLRVVWRGESGHRADQLIAVPDEELSQGIRHACGVLEEMLATGPVPADTIEGARRKLGISEHAWRRAKQRIGAESFKEAFTGRWSWRLPLSKGGPEPTAP